VLATLDDLRILCLLETTQKIWLDILVGRIPQVWECENVLVDRQYGFRQGQGCEWLTLQVINALEEAEEVSTEIHGTSWDIRIAFDTISKPILQMSWQWLGVPESIAKYIVDLGKDSLTILLTPHAMYILSNKGISAFNTDTSSTTTARGFLPVTGNSQGDTPSPTNWNASLDPLLRALHALMIRMNNKLRPLENTPYADEFFSILA